MSIFSTRRDALRRLLAEKSLEALLVTDERNVTYLTGFTGDSSFLLVQPDRELVISDRRYVQQLEAECPGLELAIRGPGSNVIDFAAQTLIKLNLQALAIEADAVTLAAYEKFHAATKSTRFASISGLVT